MKSKNLTSLDLHMHCVGRHTGSESANINVQNVANHTRKRIAMSFIQTKPPPVGERQIKGGEEEIGKEIIGTEGIKEARLEVGKGEEIEVKIGEVSLQNMRRETSHLSRLGKESRKLTRETRNRKLKMILLKKGKI